MGVVIRRLKLKITVVKRVVVKLRVKVRVTKVTVRTVKRHAIKVKRTCVKIRACPCKLIKKFKHLYHKTKKALHKKGGKVTSCQEASCKETSCQEDVRGLCELN